MAIVTVLLSGGVPLSDEVIEILYSDCVSKSSGVDPVTNLFSLIAKKPVKPTNPDSEYIGENYLHLLFI